MEFISQELRPEIGLRIEKIRNAMAGNAEAILIAGNVNICYASGRFFRGYVYVPLEGRALWFVVRPVGFEGEDVVYIRKPEQIPAELERLGLPMPTTIGLEFNELSYADVERLRKVFPDAAAVNASPILKKVRMVKTPYEIRLMEIDGRHQSAAYRRIPKVYRPEMTDLEFQIEIEHLLRLEGCLGYSRKSGNLMEINMGSVLSGANADAPTPYDFAVGGAGADSSLPVGADGGVMLPGTTVMVDMNGAFNAYQTDLTRTWAIDDVPEKAVKMHECSRRILRELEEMGRPGTPVADLYLRAMAIVEEEGFAHYFMGYTQKAAFIGHGVGLELNELPVVMAKSKDVLAENMTLALEPKFVVPGVGAVGVENTYVVTPGGLRNITECPEELEKL